MTPALVYLFIACAFGSYCTGVANTDKEMRSDRITSAVLGCVFGVLWPVFGGWIIWSAIDQRRELRAAKENEDAWRSVLTGIKH